MTIVSAAEGTLPISQFPGVFQSVEIAPVQVAFVAGPLDVILKVFDVTEAKPTEEAFKVSPTPALSIAKSSKVAIPADTVLVVLPDKVPPPGLALMAKVTSVVLSSVQVLLY